jgi:hypothetical protein
MHKIFLALAVGNGTLLIISYALGFLVPSEAGGTMHDLHFLVALLTMLATLMVHGIVYTYMLGTNKWVQEVTRVYRLPEWMETQSKRNKARARPLVMWGMLAIGATVWLGGAADTMRGFGGFWHLMMASFTIGFTALAFTLEYFSIVAQARLLLEVKVQADRLRQASLTEAAAASADSER